MNPINFLKKLLLNIFMPVIEATNKKNDSSQEQRFRYLFKKRKSLIIIFLLIFGLITLGIGKSISFIALAIACSPFIVIFWSSYGEYIRRLLKSKNKEK